VKSAVIDMQFKTDHCISWVL